MVVCVVGVRDLGNYRYMFVVSDCVIGVALGYSCGLVVVLWSGFVVLLIYGSYMMFYFG